VTGEFARGDFVDGWLGRRRPNNAIHDYRQGQLIEEKQRCDHVIGQVNRENVVCSEGPRRHDNLFRSSQGWLRYGPGGGLSNLMVRSDSGGADRPLSPSQEVIGGYAIFDAKSKAHMLKWTERFMELHQTHMPGWEGECEVRQIPEMGEEPCGHTHERQATAV
jgi:hypothetical protein